MGTRMFFASPRLRFGAVVLGSAAAVWVQAATAPVIYPAKGQTPAQVDRDKLACFEWGKQQSGFDPLQPPPPSAPSAQPQSAQTAAAPQRSSINGSMVKGAAGGAAVAELTHGDAGKGAAVGVLGAAVRDRMKQQQQQQAKQQQQAAQQQQQRATFERAFGACLEGRGYVVK